ncbi:toprim domain-containing protein [Malikia spinosa]|uniref:toprim domain-containing protein n=1 Tax=Malikia spinosa TaxID=86180 RepID=UPI0027BAE24C|nr:toprim domain-containing protein [Malikia spinosa]
MNAPHHPAISEAATLAAFSDAIRAAGLTPPEQIDADGAIHRFSSSGKRGDESGWYVLHLDGVPAGSFGCWRAGLLSTWCAKATNEMTQAEQAANRQKVEAMRTARKADQEQRQQQAKAEAARRWEAAAPAQDYPYLKRKGIQAHGTRVEGDRLLIPMHLTEGGTLQSLQVIDFAGGKRFLPGGRVKGCFCLLGEREEIEDGAELVICEGFATGASIREATGYPVAVAFNAGNLQPVALALRTKYPGAALILAADDDWRTEKGNTGMDKATEAAQAVGARLAVPRFPEDCRPDDATDFNDLHQLAGVETVRECFEAAQQVEEVATAAKDQGAEQDDDGDKRESLAALLVAFVGERAELFHDENGDTYAQIEGMRETMRLNGSKFKNWLTASFYKHGGKVARDQAVREALSVMAGLALHDGECREVYIRVAVVGGAYLIDLGQTGNSLAVKVEPGCWSLVDEPEARFIRPDAMRALPTPERGGDLSKLWGLVNVPESARLLVLAWILDCFRPETPFPVLELLGEAGSAKSSTQDALRNLVDPNACNLRAAPATTESMFVAGGANWLVSYENISHLSAPMQDALCVLATGGGYAKRKHYTDGEEAIINVKRPVMLNGISASVTAHDLVDRAVSVELPVIPERVESAAIRKAFEIERPRILGALFELMAASLAELPRTSFPAGYERPRLVEYALMGMAMASAMGRRPVEFLDQFNAKRVESVERTIDASPVAAALIEWFEARDRMEAQLTVKALLFDVERFKPPGVEAWPRSPKGFGDALRRAAPSLRHLGIEARSLGKVGGAIKWLVKDKPEAVGRTSAGHQDIQDFESNIFFSESLDSGGKSRTSAGHQDIQDMGCTPNITDLSDSEVF